MRQTKTQTTIGKEGITISKGEKTRYIPTTPATLPIPNGAHIYYMSIDAPEFFLSIDVEPEGEYDYSCVAISIKSAAKKFKKFLKSKK